MKNRRSFLIIALLSLSAVGAAQSASFLDRVVGASRVGAADAAYLVLSASGTVPESASPADALGAAQEKGWLPRSAAEGSSLSLESYSQLLCRAFALRGGLLYRLTGAPRYAYRSLKAAGVVQGRADPMDALDGAQALRMLSRASGLAGAEKGGAR